MLRVGTKIYPKTAKDKVESLTGATDKVESLTGATKAKSKPTKKVKANA